MRPLPSTYLGEMFKSTRVPGLVLGLGGLVFLGGVCMNLPQANTKSAVSTTNTGSNSNVEINTAVDNSSSNENTNTSEIDTSDWLSYTNKEYGFSFRYPNTSKLTNNEDNVYSSTITFIASIGVDSTQPNDYKGILVDFAIVSLDLSTLTEKIEQSDLSNGQSIARVGEIQSIILNGLSVYKGSHDTAIGIPTTFYYVPLQNDKALFIFHSDDKNNINKEIINTLQLTK